MHETGRVASLALHLSGKFLTDKTRRQLDIAGNLESFARVVLGNDFARATQLAEKIFPAMAEHEILTFSDAAYPPLLAETDHAPFALFLCGHRELLTRKLISLVGTREPSAGGRLAAYALSKHYVKEGFTLVSGIARGVDAVVHHAAIDNGGATVAVLPNGFKHSYPLENRDLYEAARHSDRLLLVSEYLPEQKPQRHHFVRRNRLIAGLSAMTIVVEAGKKSGALITANHALDYGREVCALSDARLSNNAGGEALIADGASDLTALAFLKENAAISL